MAEFGKRGESKTVIPKISQETLAEMIGATRSRVNFFMNRFRKQGFIEYNGRIHVHNSLLNVIMNDQLPDDAPATVPIQAFARPQRRIDRQERFTQPEIN